MNTGEDRSKKVLLEASADLSGYPLPGDERRHILSLQRESAATLWKILLLALVGIIVLFSLYLYKGQILSLVLSCHYRTRCPLMSFPPTTISCSEGCS